ncbi:hypothetical protein AK812_SmicGene44681, partial [Symbiodinium microadriaticum]
DILVTAGRDGLVKQGAQGKDELKALEMTLFLSRTLSRSEVCSGGI